MVDPAREAPRRMRFAVSHTNLGPYHLARLRALAAALADRGGRLIAYETASSEGRYPWRRSLGPEPFDRTVLFPGRVLESIPGAACRRAMAEALDRDRPDVVGVVGYSRPESAAMLAWARRRGRPAALMSESQENDRPRVWWKEVVKRRRVAMASAALVGGPSHAAYLVALGMPADRIALGYDAVDNDRFARLAGLSRASPGGRSGLPDRPYFLAASRFVPEKNLPGLVAAFATYRQATRSEPWDLVLCGDGPGSSAVDRAVAASGLEGSIRRPGFLQEEELARWLAHASAFVLPSLSEPWGLVVNEAAACELPLLVSDRAGCAATLVPDPPGTTGWRFDPGSIAAMAEVLGRVAALDEPARRAMGRRASAVVADWGPARFASGALEAIDLASDRARTWPRRARSAKESGR